jgi:hypothetical protein
MVPLHVIVFLLTDILLKAVCARFAKSSVRTQNICFFFECGRVKEIWQNLGILSITEEACHSDREGSGVLETILRSDDVGVPGVRNGTQRINHYSLLVHVVGEEENFTR